MQFLSRKSNLLLPGTVTFLILNRFFFWNSNHMVCENWFMWSWSFIFQSSHPTCLKQNLSALQEDGDSSLLWGWLEVRGQLLFSRGKSRVLLAPFTLTFYLLLEPVSHLTTLLSQNLLGFVFGGSKCLLRENLRVWVSVALTLKEMLCPSPLCLLSPEIWARTKLSDLAQFHMSWLCSE